MIVSFLNKCGPRRKFYNGQLEKYAYDNEALDPVEMSSNDHFWDRFLQKRIVHPIAANMKPDKTERHLVVHQNTVVDLPLETSIAGDSKPVNRILRLFYKNGNQYNLANTMNNEETGHMIINHNPVPTAVQTQIPPGFSVEAEVQNADTIYTGPYVNAQSADKWLLIVADGLYHRPTDSNSIAQVPSFDMNIRSSFTIYKENL